MQTIFQLTLVPHSVCDLGTVTSFLCPSLLCSVKCKPVVPTSEAETSTNSVNCQWQQPRSRFTHRVPGASPSSSYVMSFSHHAAL